MLRTCTIRTLSRAGRLLHNDHAWLEDRRRPHPLRVAELTTAHWSPGRKLRIAFAGGTIADRAMVMSAAAEWMQYANLQIVQTDSDPSEIRCSFDPNLGSWSYIGSECLAVGGDQATMNFGWMDMGTCLHEWGHALGLIHEHQNPQAKIPWDRAKVIAYYGAAPNFWPADETIENVLDKYDGSLLTNAGYDSHSIMQYAVPAELLTDPRFAVGWNTDLSDGDKTFVRRIYPRV